MRAALLAARLLAAVPAVAGPLTSRSPFPSSAPAEVPGIAPAAPRFTEPRRDPVPPPVSERIRREGFERREREGGASFGDVLLEHRRRAR